MSTLERYGVTDEQFNRLRKAYDDDWVILDQLCGLLENRNNTKPFFGKMAEQIITWCLDGNPQYKTPLSAKQLQIVLNEGF